MPFGTKDLQRYYLNSKRSVGVSSSSQVVPSVRIEDLPLLLIHRGRPLSISTLSPTGASPHLSSMSIRDSSSKKSNSMDGTPPLTQHYEHPHVSHSATTTTTTTPNATPEEIPSLVPG